jgi:hypothetical protein
VTAVALLTFLSGYLGSTAVSVAANEQYKAIWKKYVAFKAKDQAGYFYWR